MPRHVIVLIVIRLYSIFSCKSLRVLNLVDHKIPYDIAWKWQHQLLNAQIELQNDLSCQHSGTVLILQHNHVYTVCSKY